MPMWENKSSDVSPQAASHFCLGFHGEGMGRKEGRQGRESGAHVDLLECLRFVANRGFELEGKWKVE